MKIRLKIMMLFSLLTISTCFSQNQSGIIFGGGLGFETIAQNSQHKDMKNGELFDSSYNYNFQLGYRFRFGDFPNAKLFFDIDPLIKLQTLKNKTFYLNTNEEYASVMVESHDINFQLAVSPTINYKLFKTLYIGIGIEPTWNIVTEGKAFDFPVVGRIGYSFKGKVELALTYRQGLVNTVNKNLYKKGLLSDLNIGFFIPLHTKK